MKRKMHRLARGAKSGTRALAGVLPVLVEAIAD
jgi:hypothetical protein